MEVFRRNYKADGLRESWGSYCPLQHGVRDIEKMQNSTPSYQGIPVSSSEEVLYIANTNILGKMILQPFGR